MVADLAESWGVEHVDGGKRVWFEMSIMAPDELVAVPSELPLAAGGEVDLDALLDHLGGSDEDPEVLPPSARLCVQ